MRPLGRRRFLKLAAASPFAAKGAASGATEHLPQALKDVGVKAISPPGMNPAFGGGIHLLSNPHLYALWKAGALPEWAKEDIEGSTAHHAHCYLDSDVAALRSVSVGSKIRISGERALRRFWKTADSRRITMIARDVFWSTKEG